MKIILDDLSFKEFILEGGVVELNDGNKVTFDNFSEYSNVSDYEDKIVNGHIGSKVYKFTTETSSFNLIPIEETLSKKDVYGIKNVNFTLINETDVRWDEFKKQREERGFDDSELWSLDSTIAGFIYPRLKEFCNNAKVSIPYKLTAEEWEIILGKMVKAFEYIVNDDTYKDPDSVDEGLNLFREYFFNLWD